jgi:hypothetical protein
MSAMVGYLMTENEHPDLSEAFSFAWLEGIMKAELVRISEAPDWNDLEKWPSGRVFGDTCEYRWERKAGGKIHAVFISDDGVLPDGFSGEIQIEEIGNRNSMILWGEWVDPKRDQEGNPDGGPLFYDRSIPRIQCYPIEPEKAKKKGEYPCLKVARYRHRHKPEASEKYLGEFIRCVSISTTGKEE